MMDMRRHEDEVVEPNEMGSHEPMLEPADDHLDLSNASPAPRRRWRRTLAGLCLLLIVAAPLALGAWRHGSQHREVMTTANQRRNFVPNVRVSAVKANDS